MEGDGDASRLQRFIAASQANEVALHNFEKQIKAYNIQVNTYNELLKKYQQEWDTFGESPDVKEVSPGQYQYPESPTPPTDPKPPGEPPVYPFGSFEDEDVRFAALDALLEGRKADSVLAEALEALISLKLKKLQL